MRGGFHELLRLFCRPSLAHLARRYGTDKLAHGYIPHYEHHLGPLRGRRLRLLEIGIDRGASLRMWRAYFSRALICGLDIADRRSLCSRGIHIYHGHQTDPDLLRSIAGESGGLDIVIDDGSHVNQDVLTTFGILFPLMNDGGTYVIEDVHTAYWSRFGGVHTDLSSGRTTTSFAKTLIDRLNAHWIPGRVADELDASVVALHCYPKLLIVTKGQNRPVHRPFELSMMEESLSGAAPAPEPTADAGPRRFTP